MSNQDRPRIYSIITKTRFLHIEDSLEIGKVRLFIGSYEKGKGAQSTAYHFLDVDDARVIMADLGWSKPVEFTDYKGTPNGDGKPVSRVLKIKGPKDGKYWLEIQNGPGQVIGQGAVKPAGDPDASVSIALEVWEARKLAMAITEYLISSAVARLVTGSTPSPAPRLASLPTSLDAPAPPRPAPPHANPRQDMADLFGDIPIATTTIIDKYDGRVRQVKATHPDADGEPATFYQLAPAAIERGMTDLVNELVRAPGSWAEKSARLQAAMSS